MPLAAAARADRDAVPAVRHAQPRPALPVAAKADAVRTGIFDGSVSRFSGADILHHFARPQDAGWVEGILLAAETFGQVPMVTLEPWDRDGHLALPGAGDIEALADAFRDHEGEVLVRYMHEFNYEWYPWGGNPDMFCREWDRFFATMPPNVRRNFARQPSRIWSASSWLILRSITVRMPAGTPPPSKNASITSRSGARAAAARRRSTR